jgi:hypothetical protein
VANYDIKFLDAAHRELYPIGGTSVEVCGK